MKLPEHELKVGILFWASLTMFTLNWYWEHYALALCLLVFAGVQHCSIVWCNEKYDLKGK